jgi:hypothetical protein
VFYSQLCYQYHLDRYHPRPRCLFAYVNNQTDRMQLTPNRTGVLLSACVCLEQSIPQTNGLNPACPPQIMTPPAVIGGKALGSGTTRNSLSCSGTDCMHEVLRKKKIEPGCWLHTFRSTSRNALTFSKESIDTPCTRPTLLPLSPQSREVYHVEADVAASDRSELHAYIDTRSDRPECLTLTPSETTVQYVS